MSEAIKFGDFPLQTSLADNDTIILNGKRITAATLLAAVRSSIKVGGRNLLKNSGVTTTNDKYQIGIYDYTDPPKVGECVTATIWGQLGNGKEKFSIFNGYGDGAYGLSHLVKIADGIYQGTFTILKPADRLSVYVIPKESSNITSTIERIKLERGNIPTDWSPAPEDLLSGLGGGNLQSFSWLQRRGRRCAA